MRVTVRVFSFLRDYLKAQGKENREIELELPPEATIKDVFIRLGIDQHYKEDVFSEEMGHIFQVLVNHQAVNEFSHPLQDGDTIVMFPPMSGG